MSHYVDIHVGQKIRRRRWMTDMTQKQLADAVGIKFQQIQKYSVPVSYFFEAIETDGQTEEPTTSTDENAVPADLFQGKEAIELLNCYYRWPEEQRRRLFELTKSLTKESFADAA